MNGDYIDDAILVERFQAGDQNAFTEIDNRYRPRLFRFLNIRLHSPDVADELTQETLTRAFATLSNIRDGNLLAIWIYRIAYNIFVDYLRKKRSPVEQALSYNDGVSDNPASDSVKEPSLFSGEERRPNGGVFAFPLPDVNAERHEERENVWRIAKENLKPLEFRILWAKYVEELSDDEIAILVNKNPGAVRVALTRIRKKLFRRIKRT